jgi:hypothetical protein
VRQHVLAKIDRQRRSGKGFGQHPARLRVEHDDVLPGCPLTDYSASRAADRTVILYNRQR